MQKEQEDWRGERREEGQRRRRLRAWRDQKSEMPWHDLLLLAAGSLERRQNKIAQREAISRFPSRLDRARYRRVTGRVAASTSSPVASRRCSNHGRKLFSFSAQQKPTVNLRRARWNVLPRLREREGSFAQLSLTPTRARPMRCADARCRLMECK